MKILVVANRAVGEYAAGVADWMREWHRRGHAVTLACRAGRMAETLAREGISTVVLHRCGAGNVKTLLRLVKAERFHVVHALDPTAAVWCRWLKRLSRYPFRFAVSVTAERLSLGLELGDGTAVADEEMRQTLIDRYHRYAERIAVVPFGIDCLEVSPDGGFRDLLLEVAAEETVDMEAVPTEFVPLAEDTAEEAPTLDGRRDGTPTRDGFSLLCAGDLEHDGTAAEYLVAVYPRLTAEFPSLRVTLISSEGIGEKLREAAKLLGMEVREGVARFLPYLRECDAVVATGKTATEAMAVCRPVILAGKRGHGGIFTREIFEEGKRCGYTCRNALPLTPEGLLRDVRGLLLLSEEDLAELGRDARVWVLTQHALPEIAEQTLRFYASVPTGQSAGTLFFDAPCADFETDAAVAGVRDGLNAEGFPPAVCLVTPTPKTTRQRYGFPTLGRVRGALRLLRKKNRARLFPGDGSTVCLLAPAPPDRVAYLRDRYGIAAGEKYLLVSLCVTDAYRLAKLTRILETVCGRFGFCPLYLALAENGGGTQTKKLCAAVGFGGKVLQRLTPGEVLGLVPCATAAVCGTSAVTKICALGGVPAVVLYGADREVRETAAMTGMPPPVCVTGATPREVTVAFEKLLANRAEICHNMRVKTSELRETARGKLRAVLSRIRKESQGKDGDTGAEYATRGHSSPQDV